MVRFIILFFITTGISMNASESFVNVNNINLSYKIIGEETGKPPLLLIMGYGCTKDMWPTVLLDKLSKARQVILFDNRGMGYSEADDEPFSMELLASDAMGLMDSLGIENADILGWSLGSMIAMKMAVNYPNRINKMIVYAGYSGGKKAVHPPIEEYQKLTNINGTIEERVARMFSMLFPDKWLADNPDPSEYFPEITEPVNDENILRQGQFLISWKENGFEENLSDISAQTLFITGDQDVIIPPENSKILAENLDDGKSIILKGGGHGLMYQFPEKFTQICVDFLDK